MAAELFTDLDAFNQFAKLHLSQAQNGLTLEEGLAAFRAYQDELARFKKETQPALDELDASGGSELDIEKIIAEGRKRLTEEGITN